MLACALECSHINAYLATFYRDREALNRPPRGRGQAGAGTHVEPCAMQRTGNGVAAQPSASERLPRMTALRMDGIELTIYVAQQNLYACDADYGGFPLPQCRHRNGRYTHVLLLLPHRKGPGVCESQNSQSRLFPLTGPFAIIRPIFPYTQGHQTQ